MLSVRQEEEEEGEKVKDELRINKSLRANSSKSFVNPNPLVIKLSVEVSPRRRVYHFNPVVDYFHRKFCVTSERREQRTSLKTGLQVLDYVNLVSELSTCKCQRVVYISIQQLTGLHALHIFIAMKRTGEDDSAMKKNKSTRDEGLQFY